MSKSLITADPKVMMGKPVIAGTRITVELVLQRLGTGESIDDLLKSYPHITREGILAALTFAADVLRLDKVYPHEEEAA